MEMLCQHEFQAPDECSDVTAVCAHCPLTSPPINTLEGFFFYLHTEKKALLMGLVAIHPQEMFLFFVFLLFKISFRYLKKNAAAHRSNK